MKRMLLSVAGILFWLQAFAQSTVEDCARARDPVRCEAHQAALQACSGKRGTEKQVCLDASMPPVDCNKASHPANCEAERKARKTCKGKTGKELNKCMHDEQPPKKPKRKPGPPPA